MNLIGALDQTVLRFSCKTVCCSQNNNNITKHKRIATTFLGRKKKTISWSHRMYKMPRTLLLWVSLLHIILKCEIALKLKLRVNSFDPSLYVSIHRFYCLALIGNFFPTFKVQVHSFFFSKTCLLWQTWRYLVLQYDPADSNHWPEPRLTRALANSNHFLFLLGVRVCGVLL